MTNFPQWVETRDTSGCVTVLVTLAAIAAVVLVLHWLTPDASEWFRGDTPGGVWGSNSALRPRGRDVFAWLMSLLLCSAPVPTHLFPPPPPDPIRPGYRWYYGVYELQVVTVEGECVRFRCLSHPWHSWGGMDGFAKCNHQSRARVRAEAKLYGVPDNFFPR